MEALQINGHALAFTLFFEDLGKLRAPGDFFVGVRRAAVDGGSKSLVNAGEQHQEFVMIVVQLLPGHSVERAGRVNGMHHSPMQREESHSLSLQRQRVKLASAAGGSGLEARHHHPGLQFDDLIAALVGDAKHPRAYIVIGRDDRSLAVEEFGGGAGEAGKQQSGGQGESQQAGQRFGGHHQVGKQAHGHDVSEADGGESLHAKEKCLREGRA